MRAEEGNAYGKLNKKKKKKYETDSGGGDVGHE